MTRIVPRKNVDGNGHDARQLRVSDYPFNLSSSPFSNSELTEAFVGGSGGGCGFPSAVSSDRDSHFVEGGSGGGCGFPSAIAVEYRRATGPAIDNTTARVLFMISPFSFLDT
jgi:hypothetical protein